MIYTLFSYFFTRLRLSNPWKYKVPLLISFPYMLIHLTGTSFTVALKFILLSFCTILGIAGFGYFTNDLGDRDKDRIIGKSNVTIANSRFQNILLVAFFIFLALLPWIYFPKENTTYYLLTAEILLFVLYAFPPFRLKEKMWIGVVTDSLYAYLIPFILASLTFFLIGKSNYPGFQSFIITGACWQLAVGIRNISLHQIKDHQADLSSRTKTVSTQLGQVKLGKIVKTVMIPFELILFVVFMANLIQYFPLLLAIYTLFIIYHLIKKSYTAGYRILAYRFLDDFYKFFVPLIILVTATFYQLNFAWLILLHLILFPLPYSMNLNKMIGFVGHLVSLIRKT